MVKSDEREGKMRWLWLVVIGLGVLVAQNTDSPTRLAAIAVFIALMILVFFLLSKRAQADEKKLFAAMAAHVGREHDARWVTRYKMGSWWLAIWRAEQKFYFAKTHTPFDPRHFYGEPDVREWSIQRTRETSDKGYWDAYAVNIVVKDTENPLIKIYCGKDEAVAYRICESFNQMFSSSA